MIKVIDNIISNKYSQFLFDEIAKVPWTFVPNISYGNDDNYSTSGFSYSFYLHKKFNNKEEKTIENSEYKYVAPMILSAFDAFGLNADLENVFRSRARLTLNREKSIPENTHIDYKFPHLVLLYYINTTDGDTVLYDEGNVIEKITPKRGRCVLFDGTIHHASSSSTLSPRLVINTNILFYK
jgi:hypothetical protein